MTVRAWLYTLLAGSLAVVALLIAYDQLIVDYGNDDAYLIGKAAPAVVWILTVGTLFALTDFVRWLYRSYPPPRREFWSAVTGVLGGFLLGYLVARDWSFQWLVENDLEVSLDHDEFIGLVVGLWSACAVALVSWVVLRRNTTTRTSPTVVRSGS